jgi:hypothetical protein
MLTPPCPNLQDLQPLVHLLKELQDAQRVSDLRRFIRRPQQSIPAALLARRGRLMNLSRSVVPLWLYPDSAILRWDNEQDFSIIQLRSGTLARWESVTDNGVYCSHGELLARRLLQWCRRRRSSPPRCTDSPPAGHHAPTHPPFRGVSTQKEAEGVKRRGCKEL